MLSKFINVSFQTSLIHCVISGFKACKHMFYCITHLTCYNSEVTSSSLNLWTVNLSRSWTFSRCRIVQFFLSARWCSRHGNTRSHRDQCQMLPSLQTKAALLVELLTYPSNKTIVYSISTLTACGLHFVKIITTTIIIITTIQGPGGGTTGALDQDIHHISIWR